MKNILHYKFLHDYCNFSDHCPIVMKLNIPVEYLSINSEASEEHIMWQKASYSHIDNYVTLLVVSKSMLDSLLSKINIPSCIDQCTALNCNNKKHYQATEEFHEMIVKACVTAAELCIPRCTKKSCIRQIPGWSEHVEPYRKKSMFWHYMWKQNGCPRTGWIADIRKTTRAKFHYVLRHVKRKKETILANKLGESVLQCKSTDFWSSVRKIKGVKSVNPANVDCVVGDTNISNYLSDKYKKLYNSVSCNVNNMQDLVSNTDKLIVQKCNSKCYSNHSFNVKNVTEAVKLLKRNKSDGVSQWSDSIINGCHKLFVYLNLLYNSMLKHCFSPVNLLVSTVIPIPKNNKKSLNDSKNYRGIALSSIIGKVLELLILSSNKDILKSCELQFGFKRKQSTTQCTFAALSFTIPDIGALRNTESIRFVNNLAGGMHL